jgi:arylsulfatase A-like enzyme
MVQRLDLQVGQIMALLEELGIAGNTMVMFSSDNGPHEEGGADPGYFGSNGPLTGIKRDLYEGGIRVPFIVHWPGVVEPGSETDHVSWFADMLPTFSELTGVPLPYPVDGISMLPLMKGKSKQPEHDFLYWEFHERKGKQAIRDGKWKAVKLNVDRGPDTPIELYDLSVDISESKNVAVEYPEVVGRMKALFQEARTPSDLFRFDYEKE